MDLSKRTKIVCTLGPASHTQESIRSLVKAGMNVCRLNFSHGTHEDHAELMKIVRSVAAETGEPLAILQDLQGPKIRVGNLPENGVELKPGESVIFTSSQIEDSSKKISVSYPNLHEDVKVGQKLLLDDGLLSVEVTKIEKQDVYCKILQGGTLKSHKGLNLPEVQTRISAITDKDKDDLQFGVRAGVDWIALSFVRTSDDVRELRRLLDQANSGGEPPRIIAKIEKPQAIENFDEILLEADGIMVARGDLGIEMPAERVPILQKDMIAKCLKARKPVIVATQMLDSMVRNPRPTRAETSDVANAVIDHADATMLSNETAAGEFPSEAVSAMAATIREAEKSGYDDLPIKLDLVDVDSKTNIGNLLGRAHADLRAIVVASVSGSSVGLAAAYRPEVPIIALVPNESLTRQLNLFWGVRPICVANAKSEKQLIEFGLEAANKEGLIKEGDSILVLGGEPLGETGHVEFAELRRYRAEKIAA